MVRRNNNNHHSNNNWNSKPSKDKDGKHRKETKEERRDRLKHQEEARLVSHVLMDIEGSQWSLGTMKKKRFFGCLSSRGQNFRVANSTGLHIDGHLLMNPLVLRTRVLIGVFVSPCVCFASVPSPTQFCLRVLPWAAAAALLFTAIFGMYVSYIPSRSEILQDMNDLGSGQHQNNSSNLTNSHQPQQTTPVPRVVKHDRKSDPFISPVDDPVSIKTDSASAPENDKRMFHSEPTSNDFIQEEIMEDLDEMNDQHQAPSLLQYDHPVEAGVSKVEDSVGHSVEKDPNKQTMTTIVEPNGQNRYGEATSSNPNDNSNYRVSLESLADEYQKDACRGKNCNPEASPHESAFVTTGVNRDSPTTNSASGDKRASSPITKTTTTSTTRSSRRQPVLTVHVEQSAGDGDATTRDFIEL